MLNYCGEKSAGIVLVTSVEMQGFTSAEDQGLIQSQRGSPQRDFW